MGGHRLSGCGVHMCMVCMWYGVYVAWWECIGGRCLLFKPLCLVCGVMFVYIVRAGCVDVVSVGVVGIRCVCVCVYTHIPDVCVYGCMHPC